MENKDYNLEPSPRIINAKTTDEIYLSIKVGNGQIGVSRIKYADEVLAKGDLSEPNYLGSANNLKGKSLDVLTRNLDVNPFTNRCIITTSFINQHNEPLLTKIDTGEAPEDGAANFKGKYVVNLILSFLFIFLLSSTTASAQSSPGELEYKDLETPTAPGLILFDQTPSSIEKPTTPQGLGLNLLGLAQSGGSIEFAPFWLKDHPNLTAKDMNAKKTPILSHFAISLASSKSDTLSFFAAGIRTRLYQSYGDNLQKLDSLIFKIQDALLDGDDEKADSLRKEYSGITGKPIFNIDLAAAMGGSSFTNSFEDLGLSRWAAWLTLNWRPKGDDFYFTLLSRYINSDAFEGSSTQVDLMDFGSRLNYDISKFTVSVEYVQRINFTTELYDDYRVAAIGGYKLTENLFITSSIGKNFGDVNNIIALAGINFGYSKSKVKAN
jgi:hypothetical protein